MPIFARAAGVALAMFLILSAPALAQDLPAPSPPVPESSTEVPYPAGAAGDATVVLELIVEKDGSVSRATVLEGSEPFAEHARAAVLGWRFVPAHRGGVAVAARIRAQIVFRPEESACPAAAPSPAPALAPSVQSPLPGAPEQPVEIIVSGVRREVGQTTLSTEEVRE